MHTKTQKKQKNILLIESDVELRNSLRRVLQKANYKIFSSIDIGDAKKTLDKKLFNTIIFGLNQPVQNSIYFLNQIVSHNQKPEVIVLSSFNLNELHIDFQELEIKNILIKPIKKETILDCISNSKISA